jgi:hypothetical protein
MRYYLYAGEAYYRKENGRHAMTFHSRVLDWHGRSCRGTASGQLKHRFLLVPLTAVGLVGLVPFFTRFSGCFDVKIGQDLRPTRTNRWQQPSVSVDRQI